MKSLLHIEHIYKQKTQSSKFIKDIFREEYDVYEFAYDPYNVDANNYTSLEGKNFDVVVCFQVLPPRNILDKYISFKQGVLFPIFNEHLDINSQLWKEYNDFLIINFYNAMYLQCLSLGVRSHYIQYFPKPENIHDWGDQNSAFFWNRTEHITLNTVANLLSGSNISHLHLHKALDPGHTFKKLTKNWNINITESSWHDKKEDMLDDMDKSALYIAPRIAEGIDMGFLEAMARGRCVIAPNATTMNEYIEHGVNGVLYNIKEPEKITIDNIKEIQDNAYNFIKNGYEIWTANKNKINTWITEFNDGKKSILIDEEFLMDEIFNDKSELKYIIDHDIVHIYVMCKSENVFSIYDIIQKNNLNIGIVTDQSQLEFIDAYLCSNLNNENLVTDKKWISKYNISDKVNIKSIIQDIKDYQIQYPKVTIVTVVYNIINNKRQESLIECFNSVHSQIYDGEIEHLVIDGNSTDGTQDLLKVYAQKGWIKFFSEPDTSIYEAMNKGLSKADGEFIAYMNSDDRYCNIFAIKCCIKSLLEDKSDYCFGNIFVVSASDTWVFAPGEMGSMPVATHHHHQSMFVKTSTMREMGGFNLKYKIVSDSDFTIRLYALQKKYTYIDLCYVKYYLNGYSTRNINYSRIEYLDTFYTWIGHKYNLTHDECHQIIDGKYGDWPLDTFISVYKRLSDDCLSRCLAIYYFNRMNNPIKVSATQYFFHKKIAYRLLSYLPIKSRSYYLNKYENIKDDLNDAKMKKIYFAGLNIITKVNFRNITFFNLFKGIPLLAIEGYRNLSIYILGIKILRTKTRN